MRRLKDRETFPFPRFMKATSVAMRAAADGCGGGREPRTRRNVSSSISWRPRTVMASRPITCGVRVPSRWRTPATGPTGRSPPFWTRHGSAEAAGSSPARWLMVVVEAREPTYPNRDRPVAQRLARVRHAVSYFIFAAPATRVQTLGEPTCGGATSARKVVTDRRRRGQQDLVKDLRKAVGARLHLTGKARRRAGGSSPRGCIFRFPAGSRRHGAARIPRRAWQASRSRGRGAHPGAQNTRSQSAEGPVQLQGGKDESSQPRTLCLRATSPRASSGPLHAGMWTLLPGETGAAGGHAG